MHFYLPEGQNAKLQVLRKPNAALFESVKTWKITTVVVYKKNIHTRIFRV